MRCAATVTGNSVKLRSRLSPTEQACLRNAVPGHTLCRQHQLERWCKVVGCHTSSRRREQTELWAGHYRVVGRILEIPPRD